MSLSGCEISANSLRESKIRDAAALYHHITLCISLSGREISANSLRESKIRDAAALYHFITLFMSPSGCEISANSLIVSVGDCIYRQAAPHMLLYVSFDTDVRNQYCICSLCAFLDAGALYAGLYVFVAA